MTAELVRCANCREVRYLATPPSRNGGARRERLVCRRGLDVTPRELVTPSRYCTLFNRRPPSRQEGHR